MKREGRGGGDNDNDNDNDDNDDNDDNTNNNNNINNDNDNDNNSTEPSLRHEVRRRGRRLKKSSVIGEMLPGREVRTIISLSLLIYGHIHMC